MSEIKRELIDLKGQHKWFTHIKVNVIYDKGSIGGTTRGYYLFCSPVRRERFPDGYSSETIRGGDGIRILVAQTLRNTKKQAEKVAQECCLGKLNDKDSWFYKAIDYVCRKHNLHITECSLKEGGFSVR